MPANDPCYLPKSKRPASRRKPQTTYQQPTYEKAKAALKQVRAELALLNRSAVDSLDEGLEETLTLHRLGLVKELGRSFKTTNCIENLQSLVADRSVVGCVGSGGDAVSGKPKSVARISGDLDSAQVGQGKGAIRSRSPGCGYFE